MRFPKTILVCDDDSAVRILLTRVFERRGFRVEHARDGNEALEKLLTRTYGVMLLDLTMPETNGYEVIAALQLVEKRPLVLVLSSHPRPLELDPHVVQGIVRKPFDLEMLTLLVEALSGISAFGSLAAVAGRREAKREETAC